MPEIEKYSCKNRQRLPGKLNTNWGDGKTLSSDGYVHVYIPSHHRALPNGYVHEAILIIEKVVGHPLPNTIIPHHVNENRSDNSNSNLVACQDRAYHSLIHMRNKAYNACGNANFRRCQFCRQWDDPSNMYIKTSGKAAAYHRECFNEYRRNLKRHPDRGGDAGSVPGYQRPAV